jgi:hypothetical protein
MSKRIRAWARDCEWEVLMGDDMLVNRILNSFRALRAVALDYAHGLSCHCRWREIALRLGHSLAKGPK